MNRAKAQRGSMMLVVVGLILAIAVTGVAMISITGQDMAAAGQMSRQEAAYQCAEAGIEYGRRFLAQTYNTTFGTCPNSNQWNSYLNGPMRYDPAVDGAVNGAGGARLQGMLGNLWQRGDGNCDGALDPGTDLDGDTKPDFLISVRDDDDERPMGSPGSPVPNNPLQDNNMTLILRSECTNPKWRLQVGGVDQVAVVEATVTYIPSTSGSSSGVNQGNANGGTGSTQ